MQINRVKTGTQTRQKVHNVILPLVEEKIDDARKLNVMTIIFKFHKKQVFERYQTLGV